MMNNLFRRLLAFGAAGALSLGILSVVKAENAPVEKPQTKVGGKGRRMGGERGMLRVPGLNLTDDQKAKLKAMHEELKPKREAITKDTTLSATDRKQKLGELRKEAHQKLLAVLTPEQREKLAAHRKEMKAKRAAKKNSLN